MNEFIKFGEICQIVLKILNRNIILMSINGHNSVTNKSHMTGNNPNLDIVNINAYIKGSLTVWALYANFSGSQNAAFELLVWCM